MSIETKQVDKKKYKNYLQKADELYSAMENSYDQGNWNACVVNAIHCAINSVDAITVFYLGIRHSGERHTDAVQLLKEVKLDQNEVNSKGQQLSSLLNIKSAAEYTDQLMNQKDAENAKKACDRIYSWAKEKLK